MPQPRHRSSKSIRRRSSTSRKSSFLSVLSFKGLFPKTLFKSISAVIADKPSSHCASPLAYLSKILYVAFASLISLFIISFAFSLFPLRLTQPEWYLRVCASFAEAAPLLIVAFSFAIASTLISGSTRLDSRILFLRRISRFLVSFLLILLPAQLIFSVRFANRNFNANQSERFRIVSQAKSFEASFAQTTSKAQFQNLLLQKGIGVDIKSLNSISLSDAKIKASKIFNTQVNQQLIQLNQLRKRRLITDTTDALKLIFSWLAIIFYFAVFQRVARSLVSCFMNSSSSSSPQIP